MADSDNHPISQSQLSGAGAPRLMAIVEVDKEERVYCAQPGCHHTVHKAIHVVKEGDKLLLLGSTCFQKRFGSLTALGKAQHWGGNGKALTSEERALLAENTQALLDRFEAEGVRLRAEASLKLKHLREDEPRRSMGPQIAARSPVQIPGMQGRSLRGVFPWPWIKPISGVAAFKLRDGSGWVRVQHEDGRHFIVPWPTFEGWDEAMPPVVGRADLDVGGYQVVEPVVDAIAYLRTQCTGEKITGVWSEVTALLGSAARRF